MRGQGSRGRLRPFGQHPASGERRLVGRVHHPQRRQPQLEHRLGGRRAVPERLLRPVQIGDGALRAAPAQPGGSQRDRDGRVIRAALGREPADYLLELCRLPAERGRYADFRQRARCEVPVTRLGRAPDRLHRLTARSVPARRPGREQRHLGRKLAAQLRGQQIPQVGVISVLAAAIPHHQAVLADKPVKHPGAAGAAGQPVGEFAGEPPGHARPEQELAYPGRLPVQDLVAQIVGGGRIAADVANSPGTAPRRVRGQPQPRHPALGVAEQLVAFRRRDAEAELGQVRVRLGVGAGQIGGVKLGQIAAYPHLRQLQPRRVSPAQDEAQADGGVMDQEAELGQDAAAGQRVHIVEHQRDQGAGPPDGRRQAHRQVVGRAAAAGHQRGLGRRRRGRPVGQRGGHIRPESGRVPVALIHREPGHPR